MLASPPDTQDPGLHAADPHGLVLELDPPVAGLDRLTAAEALHHAEALAGAARGAEAVALLRRALGPAMPVLVADEAMFREVALASARLRDPDGLAHALGCRLGTPVRCTFDDADPPGPTMVRWAVRADRSHDLTLHRSLEDMHARDPGLHFTLMDRLLVLAPLLAAYGRSARAPGATYLNLGDERHGPGLSFCDHAPGSALIPDSHFMASHGYAAVRAHHAAHPVPWARRHRVALWRGSSTGYRGPDEPVESLERVRLCRMAREAGLAGLMDVGLTALVQLRGPEEERRLRETDLVRPFVPPERFAEWRYQIDIDGNTSSWPGLMQKLLTGSPVLKVASARGWRQWYYDRLRPWENVVPVAADLSDLVPALERLRSDDALARRIGAAGAALAASLDFEGEVGRALPVVEGAMREG